MKPVGHRHTDALRAELARCWCPWHRTYHPREEFAVYRGKRARYCRAGRLAYQREYRILSNAADKHLIRYAEDPEYREKVRARARLGGKIARGTLIRGECEVCGTTEDVHGHHESYDKDWIIWLCASCHTKHHRRDFLVRIDLDCSLSVTGIPTFR